MGWMVCHSRSSVLQHADIVVSAIGKPEFVQGSWLKPGAIVIDVGTNYIPGMQPSRILQIEAHLFCTVRRRNKEEWPETRR